MSSKPQWSSKNTVSQEKAKGFSQEAEPENKQLPFEPTKKRKKSPPKETQSAKKTTKQVSTNASRQKSAIASRAFNGVPEVVSKRMARRMAFFCGIPTGLGMLTFVVSYFIVSQHLFKLPTVVVLLTSLGFFGLGVLGLSYGALSASWDEDRVGTWFGFSEFKTNFGRTIKSWQSARETPSS